MNEQFTSETIGGISSSKFQAPTSRENPNSKHRKYTERDLELDYWSFIGAWMLVLGAFS